MHVPLYPVFLNLTGRPVLVVGGGRIAARKAERLLACGARVTVVAPTLSPEIEALAGPALSIQCREYRDTDLEGQWLVIAATDQAAVNQAVFDAAGRAGIFCNAVDQPDRCSFQVPALVQQGLLQIAISTDGASPALARQIRQDLEHQFGPAYAELLEILRDLRKHLKERFPDDQPGREEMLKAFMASPAVSRFLAGDNTDELAAELKQWKSR